MNDKAKHRLSRPLGLRGQLCLLVLSMGCLCILLFLALWSHRLDCMAFLSKLPLVGDHIISEPQQNFWDQLIDAGVNYDIPESEDDTERVQALEPFFNLADDYTGIYIYGLEDGLYRAGRYPPSLEGSSLFLRMGYSWTGGVSERSYDFVMPFRNGNANLIVTFYHLMLFEVPWFLFCLFLCVGLFLASLLIFIGRKVRAIRQLEQGILIMAGGDLTLPIGSRDRDELGTLGRELDQLRSTLQENLERDRQAQQANADLIAALSHDLRTPLTVLQGYLDILHLERDPDRRKVYEQRCMDRVGEIRVLTDQIFRYAALPQAETKAAPNWLPVTDFLSHLEPHISYLTMAGFQCALQPFDRKTLEIWAEPVLLERCLGNLFSNVLKYGQKQTPILLTLSCDTGKFIFQMENTLAPDREAASTGIGLKSVQQAMEKMDGAFSAIQKQAFFTVWLMFRLHS